MSGTIKHRMISYIDINRKCETRSVVELYIKI